VTSEGDMRKAITTLQSAARLRGAEAITKADIVEISGVGTLQTCNWNLWKMYYVPSMQCKECLLHCIVVLNYKAVYLYILAYLYFLSFCQF